MFSLAPYWSTTNWADWNRLRRSRKKTKLLIENLHSAFILWLLNGVIIWFGFRGGLIRRLRFLLSLKSFTDKLHCWTPPELWSIFRWKRSFETTLGSSRSPGLNKLISIRSWPDQNPPLHRCRPRTGRCACKRQSFGYDGRLKSCSPWWPELKGKNFPFSMANPCGLSKRTVPRNPI